MVSLNPLFHALCAFRDSRNPGTRARRPNSVGHPKLALFLCSDGKPSSPGPCQRSFARMCRHVGTCRKCTLPLGLCQISRRCDYSARGRLKSGRAPYSRGLEEPTFRRCPKLEAFRVSIPLTSPCSFLASLSFPVCRSVHIAVLCAAGAAFDMYIFPYLRVLFLHEQ